MPQNPIQNAAAAIALVKREVRSQARHSTGGGKTKEKVVTTKSVWQRRFLAYEIQRRKLPAFAVAIGSPALLNMFDPFHQQGVAYNGGLNNALAQTLIQLPTQLKVKARAVKVLFTDGADTARRLRGPDTGAVIVELQAFLQILREKLQNPSLVIFICQGTACVGVEGWMVVFLIWWEDRFCSLQDSPSLVSFGLPIGEAPVAAGNTDGDAEMPTVKQEEKEISGSAAAAAGGGAASAAAPASTATNLGQPYVGHCLGWSI